MTDDELKGLFEGLRREFQETTGEIRRELQETTAETRQEMQTMRRELQETTAETRQEMQTMRRELQETTAETRRELHTTTADLRREIQESAAETRRHFDVVAEGMRHEIGIIAERVIIVDERLTREAADIRDEMRRGFADTQAMIHFSHDELHRRVRALEETSRNVEQVLAKLQARVDRLEASQ